MARQRLVAIARDNKADPVAFRADLVNIAKTTLSSKILTQGAPACREPCNTSNHSCMACWQHGRVAGRGFGRSGCPVSPDRELWVGGKSCILLHPQ